MAAWLRSVWNWIVDTPEVLELPPNVFFEKDVTPDNDFLISCILDPTKEIKYINGTVTNILDTDKCLIDNKYQYQPKTEKEIRNFPNIEINSPVRASLYRKKNSDTQWLVASCFLSKNGSRQQTNKMNEKVRDHLNDCPVDSKKEEDLLTVQVMGDMPVLVRFEEESTIQIFFRNNSYVKNYELLDYKTTQGNKVQLSIVDKINLPLIIGIQSQYIFDITIKGKYLGKSTEKVEFIFKDITYKVGVSLDVTDSRIIIPNNAGYYSRREIDMRKLFELQNDNIVSGVRTNRVQFPSVRLGPWNIPNQLMKCYWTEEEKYNINVSTEVKNNIDKLYPATFQDITYDNYKAKFHALLFMEEIEITMALQKYTKDRIHFEHSGEYLILKMPNLSEQRPSLVPGDRIMVTDPPNCTKRLGKSGQYEGNIHRVLADEIWLKFDPEFYSLCGHWEYSVSFFHARTIFRKQHEVVDELWKKKRLGQVFLFPFKVDFDSQPPKLEITSLNENNSNTNCWNNLNTENKSLVLPPKVVQKIRWFNEKLNQEQKNAVINILKGEGRPMPYVIYGPPGTGKTITLTESIIQVYKEFPKSKLLVCAPTNSAVDMLLGKLVNSGLFDKTVLKRLISYNYFISSSYNMEFDEYCVLPELEAHGKSEDTPDIKLIKKKDILKLRIVISTEGTAGILYMMGLKSGTFTHIFVDEAGQTTEPEILLALSFLDLNGDGQVVLAGDPKQLGPVVLSSLGKTYGLGQSMLSRFINYPSYQRNLAMFPEHNGYNPKVITHLIQNYRSLPEIVYCYSNLFYNSLLVATKLGDNVRERILLNNLNENAHWNIGCKGPIVVHGIVGDDKQEPSSPSWFNPHEAFQVLLYVTLLIKAGISTDDIGVITPYASQVLKINELLKMYHSDIKLPKVGTVEMFQGQERMIIIISMVRSRSEQGREKDKTFSVGFLVAKERTNVALSRAKALVIIIGNPSTLSMNNKWRYVLKKAIENNNYIGCSVPEKSKDIKK